MRVNPWSEVSTRLNSSRAMTLVIERALTGSRASSASRFSLASRSRARVDHATRRGRNTSSLPDVDLDALLPPEIDGDLESLQREAGAVFGENGYAVRFGDVQDEIEAIKNGAAVVDRSDWGLFRSHGRGALNALRALAMNGDEIATLGGAGSGFEIKLESTGESAQVYAQSEGFILIVPPTSADAVADALDALAEQQFAELNDQCAFLTVLGPKIDEFLSKTGLIDVMRQDVGAHQVFGFANRPVVAARSSEHGVSAVNLIVDESIAGEVWATVVRTGVTPCGSDASDAVLIELGRR